MIDLLEPHLPLNSSRCCHEPDGNFPNGVPNPLVPENRTHYCRRARARPTSVWAGTGFRPLFFFDEHGEFIEGYYVVGLLAEAFLNITAPRGIGARPAPGMEHH